MPTKPLLDLDDTDRAIIAALQADARTSVADLARAVSMSASATADRLRHLTDHGVITGCTATVSSEALGRAVTAFVRLACPTGNYQPFHDLMADLPEVVEAHHVTGEDCFLIKVLARSMADLERTRDGSAGWARSARASSAPAPVAQRGAVPAWTCGFLVTW